MPVEKKRRKKITIYIIYGLNKSLPLEELQVEVDLYKKLDRADGAAERP